MAERTYAQRDADQYVKYLGCWTYMDPPAAVSKRDPGEYRALLYQLIRVNRSRDDDIGWMEVKAAKAALVDLEGRKME